MPTFIDAPQPARCRAVVTLRDKTTADCGRRATYCGFCWQHARKAVEQIADVAAALLDSAASINRDYLRLLPAERRNNPTENYVERFQYAAAALRRANREG